MGGASENMETAKHVEVDYYVSSTPESSTPEPAETIDVMRTSRQTGFNDLNLTRHGPPVSKLFIPANPPAKDASRLFVSKEDALEDALDRLYDLAAECAEADWDGYGAEAVSQSAVERSERFIRRLPEDLPLPEISVEPDGEIALDWSPTQTQTFSVSIGTTDQMACAWVNGTEHGHVVVSSTNGEIPWRILQEIQCITNQ